MYFFQAQKSNTVSFSDLDYFHVLLFQCSRLITEKYKRNELHGLKSKTPQNCPHLFVGCISPAAWPVRSALPVCLLTRVFWDLDDDLDDDPDHPAGSAPGTGGPGGVGDSIHPQGSRCMSPFARRLGLSSLDSPHCSNASAGLTLQHCSTAAVLARWHQQQQLCKFSCRRPGEPIARERRGTKLDVNTKYSCQKQIHVRIKTESYTTLF